MANLLESALILRAGNGMSAEMVKVFLDHGADPNYASDHGLHIDAKPTPWKLFLLNFVKSMQMNGQMGLEICRGRFHVFAPLINAGVNLDVAVYAVAVNTYSSGYSVERLSVDEVILMTTLPEDASFLSDMIEQRRRASSSGSNWLGQVGWN